jgi:hypothetical protein
MPTEKRDRYLKRVRRRAAATNDRPKPGQPKREALAAAAADKSQRLRELAAKYEPKIVELHEEWAAKRAEVWADYEERKRLISDATLIGV